MKQKQEKPFLICTEVYFPLEFASEYKKGAPEKPLILVLCFFVLHFWEKSSRSYGWVCGDEKGREERALIVWRIFVAASWSTETWIRGRAEEAGSGGEVPAWAVESHRPGFHIQVYTYLVLWPWMRYLFSLRLRIFACKMGLIRWLTSWGCCEDLMR